MKLHFEQRSSILSVSPKVEPVTHKDLFIYYSDKYLIVVDLVTDRVIHKFKYNDVQFLRIHNGMLYICAHDIHIMDLEQFGISDVLKLSKALITKIAISENHILISKTNKKVTLIKNKKVQFEIQLDNFCEGVFVNSYCFGYFDAERVVAFSSNNMKILDFECDQIVSVHPTGNALYAIENNGTLHDFHTAESVATGLVDVRSCIFHDEYILCVDGEDLVSVSYSGEILEKTSITNEIERYSGAFADYFSEAHCSENDTKSKKVKPNSSSDDDSDIITDNKDCSVVDSVGEGEVSADIIESEDNMSIYTDDESNDSKDYCSVDEIVDRDDSKMSDEEDQAAFVLISESLIKTSENDFIFTKNLRVTKIISFLNNLTGSAIFEDSLVLTTFSGFVKFTKITGDAGERLFDSRLIKITQSGIVACKLYENVLVTGGKGKTVEVFKIERSGITKVFEFGDFRANITSLDFRGNLLCVSTSDNLLHIFQSTMSCPQDITQNSVYLFFTTFENVSVQKLHSKSINNIQITSKFIITSSTDKTSKILDHSGCLVKEVASDKVLNTTSDDKYIAVCSHKAARVFTQSLSSVCVFQTRKPVLSSCFYRGYLIGVSDVLRIYDIDKKKCVRSYDLGLINCWNISNIDGGLVLCGENRIVFFSDVSQEKHDSELETKRVEKENTVLFERFILEGNFAKAVEVALKKNDESDVLYAMSRGFRCFSIQNSNPVEFMDVLMKNGETRFKIFDILVKNSTLKNSLIFNEMLGRFYKETLDKKMKEKIKNILQRQVNSVDLLFADLYGLLDYLN